MKVNFDNLRTQAVHSYNRVVEELNEQIIEGYVRFHPVDIQEHMDDLRMCLVTLISLQKEGEFTSIDMTLEHFNPETGDDY